MTRQSGLAILGAGLTIALLALSLVLSPGPAAQARSQAQGTPGASVGPLMPLYFFLIRPNPQFALTLNGLRLTETQSTGLAIVLAEEARLLADAQTRKTLNEDIGPIAQASWDKLKASVLTTAQYETLSRWADSQRDFAVQVLRDTVTGSAALATAGPTVATTGTPTVPPAIQNLMATVQAATPTRAAGTAVVGTPGSAGTQPAPPSPTATPPAPTPTATQVLSMATMPANATATSAAARPAGSGPGSLTVVGEGRAQATPNVARLTLGIEVISDTVRLASGEANQRTQAIITKLKGLGVADKDLQTSNYSIFPYREPERPVGPATQGAPTPARPRNQYRVSSTLRVTVRDLNNVSAVIDGAVEAGANTVGGIQFTVEDPTPAQDQARANAFADARRRALQLAQLAGATLGPPTYITEVIGSAPPAARAIAAPAAVAPALAGPPIEAGELNFVTQLQITFELR